LLQLAKLLWYYYWIHVYKLISIVAERCCVCVTIYIARWSK